jgi:intracellular multiplication protein IcmL
MNTTRKDNTDSTKEASVKNRSTNKVATRKTTNTKTNKATPDKAPTKEKKDHDLLGAEQVVKLRLEFFKEGSRKLKIAIYVSLFCLILSSISAFLAVSKEGERAYFAADESGQYVELITLDRPNHKSAVVSQWLSDALIDTFDFNYLNMKQVLNNKSIEWFTDSGRNSLITSISETGSFSVIVKEKLIVQLNLIRAPVLVREGVSNSGKYEWLLQVEGKFTYTNEGSVYTNDVLFTVSVTRRSMLEDIKGLGINKIIVEFTGKR